MPTYTYCVKETGEIAERVMTIAERDAFFANTAIEQVIVRALAPIDPHRLESTGTRRPTKDFLNRLAEIKRAHRHSTIRTGSLTEV